MTQLPGGLVISASPTGYAWRDGIRAGQRVVAIGDAASSGGWWIETSDGANTFRTQASEHDGNLSASLPLAIVAAAFAGLALLLARGHARGAGIATAISVVLASYPIGLFGDPGLSDLVLTSAVVLPVGFLAFQRRIRPLGTVVILGVMAAFLTVWFVARSSALESFDNLERIREGLAAYGLLGVLALAAVGPIVRREVPPLDGFGRWEILSAGIATGLAVALIVVLGNSPVTVGVLLIGAVAGYPRWRRFAARSVDRLVLADLREEAALEASEEERARIARDLHDTPLQQVAGVILHLEAVPGAEVDVARLREVAHHLRGIATELRPPMLDDLGLVPSLEFLAEQATTPTFVVVAAVTDETDPRAGRRPPTGVELAAFRISQEAVGNAIRHSGGHSVRIEGIVAEHAVRLEIHDDGRGIVEIEAEAASRQGRLGLASMRRRAATVEGVLDIRAASGTTVAFRWPR